MNQLAPDAFWNVEPQPKRRLRALSTCSGISAASAAFDGLPIDIVAYAEIDPFACFVLHHRLGVGRPRYMPDPDAPGLSDRQRRDRRNAIKAVAAIPTKGISNLGDMTQITDDDLRDLGRVDLLEGGTPCQAFSLAGLRRGLADDRGNITLEFCRLLNRMRSLNDLEYCLWENVPGVLSDRTNAFGCLLAGLAGGANDPLVAPRGRWTNSGHVHDERTGASVAWRLLDAEHFGIAQRRPRVYAIASFGAVCAGEVLFERRGEAGPPRSGGAPKEDASRASPAGAVSAYGIVDYETVSEDRMPTLQARSTGGGRMEAVAYFADRGQSAFTEGAPPTLRHYAGDCSGGSEALLVERSSSSDLVVRRLTPIECERVQGFPDGWTAVPYRFGKPAPDQPRYRALGNSMAVPVISWIAGRLLSAIARQRSVDRIAAQRARFAA